MSESDTKDYAVDEDKTKERTSIGFIARLKNMFNKGFVRTKQLSMVRCPTTDEQAEVTAALQRYELIKQEISAVPGLIKHLHDARVKEAKCLLKLSQKLKDFKFSADDSFNIYSKNMGEQLSKLHLIQIHFLNKMADEFLIPFETFKKVKITQVEQAVLEYKTQKMDFDSTAHKVTKLQEKLDKMRQAHDDNHAIENQQKKIKTAEDKNDEALYELNARRKQLKEKVDALENEKKDELVKSMREFQRISADYLQNSHKVLTEKEIANVGENDVEEEELSD